MTYGGSDRLDGEHFLLYGWGITNAAVATALVDRGRTVVVADDRPGPTTAAAVVAAGASLIVSPGSDEIAMAVAEADAVIPAPGLPESHRVFAAAEGASVPVLSEFDLAAAFDDRPLLSITGTNGKTTVTTLVTLMLECSGLRAEAVGNTDVPLVSAIADPDTDVFVVESSSFRLARTHRFRPKVATWLNFAEDHLDVHSDVTAYEAAKARQWRDLDAASTAVANVDDETVVRHIGEGSGRFVTFGLDPSTAHPGLDHFTYRDGSLRTPDGTVIVEADEMFRSLPHDVSNALAASATALAGGASLSGVRAALREFQGLSHRVELVASANGVDWFDDSKATAPHAVIAAVEGFESVVLIAGGRNKGLDLGALARLRPRLRGVVGIGESGAEVLAVFEGLPAMLATSMREAVAAAAEMAGDGDAVVLSPGCASFDWYDNYGQRGDDFAAEVRGHLEVGS